MLPSTQNNLLKLKLLCNFSKLFNEPNLILLLNIRALFLYENLRPRQEDPNSKLGILLMKSSRRYYSGALEVFAPPYETAFDSCGAVLDKKALSESETQFPDNICQI